MTAHLVAPDGSALCPEAALRDAMSDAEFWDHVFNGPRPADGDDDFCGESLDPVALDTPCPECGVYGACAFDIDGRPLIHATAKET